ncbi:MAG: gamma-glutamyl-gamma-aminobutyrate hydrolase family protein [Chloroflexota bacterium]
MSVSKRSTRGLHKPLIGMPTWIDQSTAYGGVDLFALNQSYINAVVAAGGIPFLIPLNLEREGLWSIFSRLDGLFLAGGTDIHPEHYGETAEGTEGRFDDERDHTELILARWSFEHNVPLFGVCRGMQMINVAAGGTLYHDLATDLPEKERHDFPGVGEIRQQIRHNIFIEADSFLGQTLGEIVGVNSMHHQAIKTVGDRLQVTAISEDGLVEGIEYADGRFVIGCQWHPEELMDDPSQARLLTGFVEACTLVPKRIAVKTVTI